MSERRYSQVCKEAIEYARSVREDPMTTHYGAPVDDIMEGYMSKHIKKCDKCKEASIEASMP